MSLSVASCHLVAQENYSSPGRRASEFPRGALLCGQNFTLEIHSLEPTLNPLRLTIPRRGSGGRCCVHYRFMSLGKAVVELGLPLNNGSKTLGVARRVEQRCKRPTVREPVRVSIWGGGWSSGKPVRGETPTCGNRSRMRVCSRRSLGVGGRAQRGGKPEGRPSCAEPRGPLTR